MEQFQPGLSFSPDNRAEKYRRLHGRFLRDSAQAEVSHIRIFIPGWVSNRAETSAWDETQPGLKFLSYNRVFCFIRILQQDWAEDSARSSGLKIQPGHPG